MSNKRSISISSKVPLAHTLSHEMFVLAMNNSFQYAPLGPSTERVLDVGTGTGTGIWAS